MEQPQYIGLASKDGFQGFFEQEPPPFNQGALVLVRFETGDRLAIPIDVLSEQEDGRFFLPMTLHQAKTLWPAVSQENETLVIPVVEERLVQHRHKRETARVRITKRVSSRVEEVDEPVLREQFEVERIPVNRPVDQPVPVRYEGDTMIVPVLEEVLVVEKQLVLKEELHITKRVTEFRNPRRIELRSEEVDVERVLPERQSEPELETPEAPR